MRDKKQTAVEWLEWKTDIDLKLLEDGKMSQSTFKLNLYYHFLKAKEMDKNNIINAASRGYLAMADKFNLEDAKEYGKEYYENTFNID